MCAEGEGAQSKEGDDEKLLEEYYLRFKGPSDDKKYHLIPKFYSKVYTECTCKKIPFSESISVQK